MVSAGGVKLVIPYGLIPDSYRDRLLCIGYRARVCRAMYILYMSTFPRLNYRIDGRLYGGMRFTLKLFRRIIRPSQYVSRSGMTFTLTYRVVRNGDDVELVPLRRPVRVGVVVAELWSRRKIARRYPCLMDFVIEALKTGSLESIEEKVCNGACDGSCPRGFREEHHRRFAERYKDVDLVVIDSYGVGFYISAPYTTMLATDVLFNLGNLYAYRLYNVTDIPLPRGAPASKITMCSYTVTPVDAELHLVALDDVMRGMAGIWEAVILRARPLGDSATLKVEHPKQGEIVYRLPPRPVTMALVRWTNIIGCEE